MIFEWKVKINKTKLPLILSLYTLRNALNHSVIPHTRQVKYLSQIFDKRLTSKTKGKKLNSRLQILRLLLKHQFSSNCFSTKRY